MAVLPDVIVYGLELLGYFLLWTGLLYGLHCLAHRSAFLWRFHRAHHQVKYDGSFEFSWRNLIGFYNDWPSTIDQWLLEILPTLSLILLFPRAWPIGILYFIDNIFAEGITDHNPRIRPPFLAMGRYHLAHHRDPQVNLDGFTQFWDWVFGTRKPVE